MGRLTAGKDIDRQKLVLPGRKKDTDPGGEGSAKPPVIPKEFKEKARAATVRIRRQPDDPGGSTGGFSGVIVTADGFVA